jgi:single-strand DNA-binding protein
MNMKNNVQLIGNIGTDVNILTFDNGNKKASFSLATNDYYTNTKGEKVKQTEWHNIIAFGKTAEILAASTKKGAEIALQGKLTTRNYTDTAGKNRYVTEVVVNEFYNPTRESKSEMVQAMK